MEYKRFEFSYKFNFDTFNSEELLEYLSLHEYEHEITSHGEEYKGGRAIVYLRPNEKVVTGVYTIRVGATDNLFKWLEFIGNRNLYESESYGFIHNDELYFPLGVKAKKVEVKDPRYNLREHTKYKIIENLVLDHYPEPQPSATLTFFILQHSICKKRSIFKEPELVPCGFSLEMFYKPRKPKGVYISTPFTSFHNIPLDDVAKHWDLKIKKRFLNNNFEYIARFEDISIHDDYEIGQRIMNIIDLIYNPNEDTDVYEYIKEEYGDRKYIYDPNEELPDKIKNILQSKFDMNVPDELDLEDEITRFGITYHPLMRILEKDDFLSDDSLGFLHELEMNCVE